MKTVRGRSLLVNSRTEQEGTEAGQRFKLVQGCTTNLFNLLQQRRELQKPTHMVCTGSFSAPTRINAEVLMQRRVRDRLQNRPQRCEEKPDAPNRTWGLQHQVP